jgi:hypothetical protein
MDQYSYTVVDGIIQDPGKFEQQPRWLPYLWDTVLEGYGDDRDDAGSIITTLLINSSDVDRYPELYEVVEIEIWETDAGFVQYRIVDP